VPVTTVTLGPWTVRGAPGDPGTNIGRPFGAVDMGGRLLLIPSPSLSLYVGIGGICCDTGRRWQPESRAGHPGLSSEHDGWLHVPPPSPAFGTISGNCSSGGWGGVPNSDQVRIT
jgi:hypothetical protein